MPREKKRRLALSLDKIGGASGEKINDLFCSPLGLHYLCNINIWTRTIMNKGNNALTQAAMKYGTLLGILWIATFAIYIKAFTTPEMSLLFLILLIASPIYAGYLGIKYRKKECNNRLGFISSWALMIIIYMCAALLSAIACYIYFQYMDNGLALSTFKEQIDTYQAMDIGEDMKKAFTDTYNILANLSASDICIQYFLSNIFVSTFLAPLTALIVYKK